MLSPIRTDITPAFLNIYLSKTESMVESTSSYTFSISNGYPNYRVFSKVLKKSLSVNLTNFISFSFSLINLLPCPCGSINRGNL